METEYKLKPEDPKKSKIKTQIYIDKESDLYPFCFNNGIIRPRSLMLFLLANAPENIIDIAVRKKIATIDEINNAVTSFSCLVERPSKAFTMENLTKFNKTFSPIYADHDTTKLLGYAAYFVNNDGLNAKLFITVPFRDEIALYPALSVMVVFFSEDHVKITKINHLGLCGNPNTDPTIMPIYISQNGIRNYSETEKTTNEA